MSYSIGRDAVSLAASGKIADALNLLERGCADGNGEAYFTRGLWRVDGRLLNRDLPKTRDDFRQASVYGYRDGGRVYSGFLAMGAGGAVDWHGALAELERWVDSDQIASRQLSLIRDMALDDIGAPTALPKPEYVADTPQGRLFRGLLTASECTFLTELVKARMRPALIFHEGQQKFVRDPLRDSDAASFPLVTEWPFVVAINRRLAAASGTEYLQGEPLQILRYGAGQQYKPHLDAIRGLSNQRILTVLVYLNDDYEGGETAFTETGGAVKGHAGDAFIFCNVTPDGAPDPTSQHCGAPVASGVKLLASRWIRMRPSNGPHDEFGHHEIESADQ